jgi:hypothetical protein
MARELRTRKNQDPVFVERDGPKKFNMAKQPIVEAWLADQLFEDFLRRNGLKDKGGEIQ